MEYGGGEGSHPESSHHVAQLADGGIGHHPFDVVHYQAHGGRHEGGKRSDQGYHGHGLRGVLEQGEEPAHQEHPGRHHCRGMDQGADRRWTLHRIGQPGVQGKLAGLANGAGEDAQGHPGQRRTSQDTQAVRFRPPHRQPDVRDVQGVQSGRCELIRLGKKGK